MATRIAHLTCFWATLGVICLGSSLEAKETPAEAVISTATSAQQRDFATFKKYIHPDFFNSLFAMQTGLSEGAVLSEKQRSEARKNFDQQLEADFLQGKGSLFFDCQNASVQEERVVGNDALVTVQCTTQDGQVSTQKVPVRKWEGKWKVVLPEFWREATEQISQLRKNKQFEEALQRSKELAAAFPKSGNIRNMVAEVYLNDLNQPEQALDYALQIKKDLPQHPGGYYWSAKAYTRLKKYPECIAALNELVQFDIWYGYWQDLAGCYFRNGQVPQTLAALEQVSQSSAEAWETTEGWVVWLQGRMQKVKFFHAHANELKTQAMSKDPQQRARALAKCGTLNVPEVFPILNEQMKDKELSPSVEKLKEFIVVDPDFRKKRDKPGGSSDSPKVSAHEALQAMWKIIDSIPAGIKPAPPLAGKYLMESMMDYYKQNPSFASPLVINTNEKGEFSFDGGWFPVDGMLAPSPGYPEFLSAAYIQGDALYNCSIDFRKPHGTGVGLTSYKRAGKDLVVSAETWLDHGDFFYRVTSESKYVAMQ